MPSNKILTFSHQVGQRVRVWEERSSRSTCVVDEEASPRTHKIHKVSVMSRVLLFSGIHAFLASVPSVLFPSLGYPLLLQPKYAQMCLEGDALCTSLFSCIVALVVGYSVSYLLAGIYANQKAAICGGIVGKTLIAYFLYVAWTKGVTSDLAAVIALSDALLAIAFIYVLLTSSSTSSNKRPAK